jgi:lipid-binding SYLF domain-containing protein
MTIRALTIAFVLIAAFAFFGSVGAGNAVGESVRETLNRLYRHAPGTQALIARSAGVLVFPTVVKAGIGVAANMAKASC